MSRTATTANDPGVGDERVERERAEVERYLLPNEEHVATVRRHPAILIVPTAQAVIGLLVAFGLTATLLRGRGVLIWIVWGIWGLVMLRLIWEIINWAVDYFVITSKRILLTSGVFTRSVAMMPLTKVTDMSFRRSFAGRLDMASAWSSPQGRIRRSVRSTISLILKSFTSASARKSSRTPRRSPRRQRSPSETARRLRDRKSVV